MNRTCRNTLLILMMGGTLTLPVLARSPGRIIRGGSIGSTAGVSPGVRIPGNITTTPAVPGVTIPGQGSEGVVPGTTRPSVGVPGQNVAGAMTPVPGATNPGMTTPITIPH